MRLRLSRAADRDLSQIGEYTIETWGLDQADVYVGGLIQHLEQLARGVRRGLAVDGFPPDWRRSRYGSHHIYYGETGRELIVFRILHQRMDGRRHVFDGPDED